MKKHSEHRHSSRRQLDDRRREELGPPGGWRERRLSVERRLPIVHENAISEAEWFRRLTQFITKKQATEKAHREASGTIEGKDLGTH